MSEPEGIHPAEERVTIAEAPDLRVRLTAHHVAGVDGGRCRFMIVQGVGPYDYVPIDE